jgi:cytochrome c biogenesis protein CcmG/thiol:disulfide interchange protein DsbE
VSLSRLRSTVVLLEFFATWCPHCQAEAPHLRELQQALPAGTYRFVGINADGESAGSVFAYHRYFGLHFPALLDPGPAQGSFTAPGPPGPVTRAYRVRYYPTFYVVDRSGRIVWRSDGEQPDALLRHELERAAHA